MRYSVPGANSGSARSTISRRLAKVARIFTAGEIAMLAVASEPDALLRHDIVDEQHAHRRVARDGAIAVLADRSHPLRIGRRGALRGGDAGAAAAIDTQERRRRGQQGGEEIRIMEAPEGEVSTQVQFNATNLSIAMQELWQNGGGEEGWRCPSDRTRTGLSSLFAGPFDNWVSLVCWPPPDAMTSWRGWSRTMAKSPYEAERRLRA